MRRVRTTMHDYWVCDSLRICSVWILGTLYIGTISPEGGPVFQKPGAYRALVA